MKRLVKFPFLPRSDFVISSEMLNSRCLYTRLIIILRCLCGVPIPSAFFPSYFSTISARLVPDVRVRFLLAFIVSCSDENDDLAQGDVNGIEIAVVLMLSRSPSVRGCRGGGSVGRAGWMANRIVRGDSIGRQFIIS